MLRDAVTEEMTSLAYLRTVTRMLCCKKTREEIDHMLRLMPLLKSTARKQQPSLKPLTHGP